MNSNIQFVLFMYLTVLLHSRCTYGFFNAFGKVNAITEFPVDSQDTEATTEPGLTYNVTLDTRFIDDTDRNWKYSSLRIKKWFEYYNDMEHLKNSTSNQTTCAHVISDTANMLEEKNGIWVSCYDSTLDEQCLVNHLCYPEISYNSGISVWPLRTVKIYLALRGLAIVRLHFISKSSNRNPTCFDYSLRKDPFSRCKYIQVNSTGEWVMVKSGFDGYDTQIFSTFWISLIARFKNDVALVDKIEATDFLLCSYAEELCTTTSPGPTRSTPPPTWMNLTTTKEITDSSTKPTTKCSIPVPTNDSNMIRVSNISVLDTIYDHIPIEKGWEISPEIPRWLEYYKDSNYLKSHSQNMSTCGSMLPLSFGSLSDVVGIWGTCTDNSQSLNCSGKFNASCHPFINYNAPETNFIYSVKATFYLHNQAILRLYVGDECVDYSYEETFSTCNYTKILQDGNYWRSVFWTGPSNYEKLSSFRLELTSRSEVDVLLIDKVQVEYRQCNNGACTSEPTTTTVVDHETEYNDCDEYEDTTIPYTTTNESDPPVTKEDDLATLSTSDHPENPDTSDTDATTESTSTTTKRTYSSSPHSMIPTISVLAVGSSMAFFNWKY